MTKQSEFPRRLSRHFEGSRAEEAGRKEHSEGYSAEIVSGRWLVKAILAAFVVAAIALYLTVCLLFYQGQWQFTFSPPGTTLSRSGLSNDRMTSRGARGTGPEPNAAHPSAATVAVTSGLPIVDEHFDYTEEGNAQLDGWWIPATSGADGPGPRPGSAPVVLFCPDGHSDLPGNLEALRAFHTLGVSIFAFDYRGFGQSQPGHPSQRKAYEDGAAALRHVTNALHIDPAHIIVYGAALGSAVAVHVAWESPQIAGIILENPQPSMVKQVRREQHIHMLPIWLIFSERFDISRLVPLLTMPKLVISTAAKPEYRTGAQAIYGEAIGPKKIVQLNMTANDSIYTQPAWQQAVGKFLKSLRTPSH